MNKKEIEIFISKTMCLFGFSGWTYVVKHKHPISNSDLALVEVDILEKILFIYLSKEFDKLQYKQQKNILIHEVIHGRVCMKELLLKRMIGEQQIFLEEDMVNDITRGIERLIK